MHMSLSDYLRKLFTRIFALRIHFGLHNTLFQALVFGSENENSTFHDFPPKSVSKPVPFNPFIYGSKSFTLIDGERTISFIMIATQPSAARDGCKKEINGKSIFIFELNECKRRPMNELHYQCTTNDKHIYCQFGDIRKHFGTVWNFPHLTKVSADVQLSAW